MNEETKRGASSKPPLKNWFKRTWASLFVSEKPVPRKTRILNWLIAFFGLTTIALCIWGIPESLVQTDTQINNFWELVDDIYYAQANTTATLQVLSTQLVVLGASVTQIESETDRLVPLVERLGGAAGTAASDALNVLSTAANAVNGTSDAISSAVDAIDKYLGGVSSVFGCI